MPGNVGSGSAWCQRHVQPLRHAPIGSGEGGDVRFRRVPWQRDADRLTGQQTKAHSRQHMAGGHLAGAARCTGTDCDAFEVQRDHLRVGAHAGECQARSVDQPARPGNAYDRPSGDRCRLDCITQRREVGRIGGCRGRSSKAGDGGQGGCAASSAALLSAAGDQRGDGRDLGGQQQGASARRSNPL